jgi:hypothetical protein
VRRGISLAVLALSLHCGGRSNDETSLDEVASQINFKSVETLGKHHMLATIRQETTWSDGGKEVHEETVELAWNDWDSFHLRRIVRGATASETIVDQGQAFHRNRGPVWQKEIDVEPARMRVRTSWSAWDTAMEVFTGRVKLTAAEHSIVDGRAAQRFEVSLAPLESGRRIRSGMMVPQSISGEVWLDEGTAVRLAADVQATVSLKGMTRKISLHLRRSSIGAPQTISAPAAAVRNPADVLRERMRGRRAPSGTGPKSTQRP